MITHLMLDFETLGNTPDTAVLSLGAVLFNREAILEEKQWVFNLEDQLRAKLTVNPDTLIWWLEQGERARSIFKKTQSEGIAMKMFLPEFHGWINGKDVRVWGNGATFDVSIAEHLITKGQFKIPWKFWNVRCYRTMKSCFGIEKGVERKGTHHDALDDTKHQAGCLMAYWKQNPEADK